MKKTLSTIVLASALLLGTVAPVAANADTTTDPAPATTAGSVTFTKPAAVTTPVDPNDPGTTSVTPGDNGGAKPSGDLTFLYVTKTLDFGTHATSTGAKQTFTAGTNEALTARLGKSVKLLSLETQQTLTSLLKLAIPVGLTLVGKYL